MEKTAVEELTEHFYEAHQNSDLGRWYLHAEKQGFDWWGTTVDVTKVEQMTAFVDSTLKELDALRDGLFILASRLDSKHGIEPSSAP